MSWVVYCLQFHSKTYVGATLNFSRRIRQHNCEISGGARFTTNRIKHATLLEDATRWTPVFVVHGFPHQRAALQFEWALKHHTRGQKGRTAADRRKSALHALMQMERVTSNAELLSKWPLHVESF